MWQAEDFGLGNTKYDDENAVDEVTFDNVYLATGNANEGATVAASSTSIKTKSMFISRKRKAKDLELMQREYATEKESLVDIDTKQSSARSFEMMISGIGNEPFVEQFSIVKNNASYPISDQTSQLYESPGKQAKYKRRVILSQDEDPPQLPQSRMRPAMLSQAFGNTLGSTQISKPSHWVRPSVNNRSQSTQKSGKISSNKLTSLRPSFGKGTRNLTPLLQTKEPSIIPRQDEISFHQPWLKAFTEIPTASLSLQSPRNSLIEEFEPDEGTTSHEGNHPTPAPSHSSRPSLHAIDSSPCSKSFSHRTFSKAPVGSLRAQLQKIMRTSDSNETKLHASAAFASKSSPKSISRPSDPLDPRNMAKSSIDCAIVKGIGHSGPFTLCLVKVIKFTKKFEPEDLSNINDVSIQHSDELLSIFRSDRPANENRLISQVGAELRILDPVIMKYSHHLLEGFHFSNEYKSDIMQVFDMASIHHCMICTNLICSAE